MRISDISVTRPVFATVLSLLLIAFGVIAFERLPLREYPDIDPPVVSVDTAYPGAAASIVETRITKVIEDRISGVEGIKYISSTSEDGRSRISIEFEVGRDIDAAANDVRDRVSRLLDNLPEEADPPEVQKTDTSDTVVLWLNLTSETMSVLELTDYANRYLEDRFSVLTGVARVQIGGGLDYSMRVWLDRNKLAARNLTVADVENALRAENVELPAGSIESIDRQFTARIIRGYKTPEDFRNLVISRGDQGYLVRLGDVARVDKEAAEKRTLFRGNGRPMIGIGIVKQSKANAIAVSKAARAEAALISETLPEGMRLFSAYDTSVFIERAVHEVYITFSVAIALVILVIYVFLGSFRATLVPAVAVPVSLMATFIILYSLGFSVNLMTLLALVLAIGIVVDDAIVVLENIYRRIEEGETPLVAAYHGTRQVGFAVLATTAVLVAVFLPVTFIKGDLGRIFSEFAITMAAAVGFSMFVALTLSPVMASKLLKSAEKGGFARTVDKAFLFFRDGYGWLLRRALKLRLLVALVFLALVAATVFLYQQIPAEFTPREDKGAFFINVNGPEGASFEYMRDYMDEIERRLLPYVESGEVQRLLVRAPRSFGNLSSFNSGIIIVALKDWSERRPAWPIMAEVSAKLADLPGVRAFPIMRQGFGGGTQKPVQFVIGGGTYDQLEQWRDILLEKINADNPGLTGVEFDYKETKPQINISINRNRAADLGVSIANIGRTLETMLGSRRVTTYIDEGEEYDVILEGDRETQRTSSNLENIYVRSERSGQMIPLSNLVDISETADSNTLNRYNRVRSITLEAGLAEGYTLGEALKYLERLVRANLPPSAVVDYKGQSLDYKTSGGSMLFVFMMGLLVVYLVLAAQFESFIHPFVIILTVPLAVSGALLGIWMTGGTLNVYTQIGLIMLVGLAAKNGILIVEFANQLRDQGVEFMEALVESSKTRLRPILMTSITAVAGASPLVLSSGAGAETRFAVGVVIISGVSVATILTLFVVPAAYALFARRTGSPGDVRRRLKEEEERFLLEGDKE